MRLRTAPLALRALLAALGAVALIAPLAAQGKKASPAANPVERKEAQAKNRHAQILARVKKGDVDLVFLGDSITDGWGGDGRTSTGTALYKARYEPLKAANLGVGADQTQHALWRITRGGELKGTRPKLVVLMMGINNVASGQKPEQIAEGHAALIKAIQANHAGTKVLLVSTFPAGKGPTHKFRAPVKALNVLLARLADGDKVRFLDLHNKFLDAKGNLTSAIGSDGIHLTATGYKVWADGIQPSIDALVGKPGGKPTAPATDRTRWVHADGELTATGNGTWEETNKGRVVFRFVEKGRTADHVELFDASRDYTVRLTDTAMLIKGGSGAQPRFADFTRQRDGRFAPKAIGPVRRLQWKHADGFVQFEYEVDVRSTPKGKFTRIKKWTETVKGRKVFTFVEKGRTAAHIELFDESRDYTVRLTDTTMLIKGGKGAQPKFADFTRQRDGKWVADFPAFELGKLSEQEESSGRGPGTVSTGKLAGGKPDRGGVSYGTYQLSSTLGRADTFVKKFYPKLFAGLKAGTPAFSAKWKELAKKDPDGLHKNEHDFIKETHHDVQVAKLAKTLKLDVGLRSRVFQDVVWSTAVQHGPDATHIVNALKPLLKNKSIDQLTEEEMIRVIYAERTRRSPDLADRFVRERKNALAALESK